MQRISHHTLRSEFRRLLASDRCYHTASVFDPMSARIAADLEFEVGILGGSVASLQVLAAPDFALITLSEFVEQATRIGRVPAVRRPVGTRVPEACSGGRASVQAVALGHSLRAAAAAVARGGVVRSGDGAVGAAHGAGDVHGGRAHRRRVPQRGVVKGG